MKAVLLKLDARYATLIESVLASLYGRNTFDIKLICDEELLPIFEYVNDPHVKRMEAEMRREYR